MKLRFEQLESRFLLTVYDVGQGHSFLNLRDVPWNAVGAGDQVLVYWQPTPYHDKIALNMSGTPDAHVQIIGVPGPDGQLPVLEADQAYENPQASYWTNQVAQQGVITIAPGGYDPYGYKPSYIDIENLEIQDATRHSGFFMADGTPAAYNWGAAGIAIYRADNITIQGCKIHDNEDGIFGKSDGWEGANLRNISVLSNRIYNNGVVGEYHYHNTYIEAIGVTYEFNYFGPPVAGSAGLNVKDRSAGMTFAYNYVVDGNTLLDLVDPEDGGDSFVQDPLWGQDYVYGNVLVNDQAGAFVHFGGDTGVTSQYRPTLYFYNNTVINQVDQQHQWRTILFYMDTNDQTVYVGANIFYSTSANPGQTPSQLLFGEQLGNIHLIGASWISAGFGDFRTGLSGSYGTVVNDQLLLVDGDPGFRNVGTGDYELTPDSEAIGQAQDYTVFSEYRTPEYQWDPALQTWVTRINTNNLGGIEMLI
jgi:hypothetical protein